ncbi:transposase [Thermotalea metallivorans]|uniref:Transposase DDE domain-containing protein n=1 Tax=Thermotalea metallivorans TaxID=520762 RepID=A0A140LBR9_9FIRM|nr:hypothetical protein AN619_03040 [Thermotalea metallivorans]
MYTEIIKEFRKLVYKIKKPEMVLLDIDPTLLNTYGRQEGEGFNFHYSVHGYHPLQNSKVTYFCSLISNCDTIPKFSAFHSLESMIQLCLLYGL